MITDYVVGFGLLKSGSNQLNWHIMLDLMDKLKLMMKQRMKRLNELLKSYEMMRMQKK